MHSLSAGSSGEAAKGRPAASQAEAPPSTRARGPWAASSNSRSATSAKRGSSAQRAMGPDTSPIGPSRARLTQRAAGGCPFRCAMEGDRFKSKASDQGASFRASGVMRAAFTLPGTATGGSAPGSRFRSRTSSSRTTASCPMPRNHAAVVAARKPVSSQRTKRAPRTPTQASVA